MLQRVAILAVFLSTSYAQTQWKQVETLHFDWAGPGQTATLMLDVPVHPDGNGDFTRLRIRTPGHREFVLADDDGFVNYRKDVCSYNAGVCKKKNLVTSDHVLLLPVAERDILFVFGWAYASSPGSFHVLALDGSGVPFELLSLREFDFVDLMEVDSDRSPAIVGKKCLSQEWGHDFLTYDPYSVYRLPKSQSGKASYSLELSKQYNLKHYYGWVGPDCSEEYAVVLHPPGRKNPIILKSKEAERLFEKK